MLVLLGLVIGAFGTLIGVGGGFLLMPILLVWRAGEEPDRLTALSLTMIFFNSLSGTIGYARAGRVNFRAGCVFALAALPGAAAGAYLIEYVPRGYFDPLFAVLLLAMGTFLLWRGERRLGRSPGAPAPSLPVERPDLRAGAIISIGVGCVASLLGIGGGVIHVPALVHLARFPVHVATATSHFVLACTSAVAMVVLAARGNLSGQYDQAAALAVGAVIGAQIGARLSSRVHGSVIVRLLGAAIVVAALRVGWQAVSRA